MNPPLPVPERTLPPQTAARIRSAILTDPPSARGLPPGRWLLRLAAALVVIALLATAVVLWPRTPQSQVVEQPTVSPTPSVASPSPTPPQRRASTPAPPASPGPASREEPFRTYRGPVSLALGERLLKRRCLDGEPVTGRVLRAFRTTNGERDFTVILYRAGDGRTWQCVYGSSFIVRETGHRVVPTEATPVIAPAGGQMADSRGAQVEWVYRTLPSVKRIQVRALLEGRSTRWFESEVHEGLAFIPIFTPGRFEGEESTFPIFFEHRAFDQDGREVAVREVGGWR